MDNRDFYIFGKPIDTKFGKIRFLTYVEYIENIADLNAMALNNLHYFYQYKKYFEQTKRSQDEQREVDEFLDIIKNEKLYKIVMSNNQNIISYKKILSLVLENVENIQEILSNEDDFLYIRNLILDMQMIQEEEVSENPEIQEFIDASKEQKSLNSEKQTFSDIISSIVVGTGMPYKEVVEMTVLQVYSTYYRIGQFRSYDTTTLFATVSSDVSIEAWNKTIDLFKTEKAGMKMSEFKKKYGGLF